VHVSHYYIVTELEEQTEEWLPTCIESVTTVWSICILFQFQMIWLLWAVQFVQIVSDCGITDGGFYFCRVEDTGWPISIFIGDDLKLTTGGG
jgi:hypothetical protein